MKILSLVISFTFLSLAYSHDNYPKHWWEAVAEDQRRGSWEILPQEAKKGEVILSKRNELGIFSNFGQAPFNYDGERYESIEGFWQMMKYPDPADKNDMRNKFAELYALTRDQVKLMHGFEGKKAGDAANKINKARGIKWVSYKTKKFNYKDMSAGSAYHYKIIREATIEKINQNPKVKALLLKTKGLILKPDHSQGSNPPPSYKYFDILMEIRDKLL